MKGTWRRGSLAFKRRSGCSATLFSYCAEKTILSEVKLSIYQKSSMACKVTWHLWLLRQLKCLTALKTPSKSQNYTNMTLLTCWVAWHKTWRIFTWLCITKINLLTVLHYPRNFGNAAKEGLQKTTHLAAYYFTLQILGILYPNVPWSCRLYQQLNRYYMHRRHHRAYRRWGTGCKQQWQELELPRRTCNGEKWSLVNRSASNALTSRCSEKTAGNNTKRSMGYLSTISRVMMVTFHLWN